MSFNRADLRHLAGKLSVRKNILFLVCFALIVALFSLTPAPEGLYLGDDWAVFHGAAVRLSQGHVDLYSVDYIPADKEPYYLYNPPWIAILLLPFAFISQHLGWAIITAATLVITLALLWRWSGQSPNLTKPLLAIISPPIVQVIIHGQIDALIIASVFLPTILWPLTLTVKPQTGLTLLLAVKKRNWPHIIVALLILIGLSFLIFGWWPADWLNQVRSPNLFFLADMWPLTLIFPIPITIWGMRRQDERLLIIASPLFTPYVRVHSLYGVWISLITLLPIWQTTLIWIAWWAVTILRVPGLG